MCVSICVALREVQHHSTVAGGWQSSILVNYASKNMSQTFFFVTDTLCMGYEYFFQKFTKCLFFSMLISTVSILQILNLEKFFAIFFFNINTAPNSGFFFVEHRNVVCVCHLWYTD
jgi:hypothetical protein